ncbi:MAG TPA: GtrA family protein [bacterium]|nr:GtrA family protein [bacterium]
MFERLAVLFSPQFIKFCVVGGLGLVTDQSIFFLLSLTIDHSGPFINVIWMVGYAVAVLQNYLINHYWTFKTQTQDTHASSRGFVSFFVVSLTALIPRFITYKAVLIVLGASPLTLNLANLCGIGAGTVVNFFGSKFLVFKKKN